jgi:PAS domain S-box-containing protein
MQPNANCLQQPLRDLKTPGQVFALLGQRLGSAATVKQVGDLALEAAEQLMDWDCGALDLYSPENDTVASILTIDLVGGSKTEVTNFEHERKPSDRLRTIITQGAQRILREGEPQFSADFTPFGDKSRPSASLLFAPVRCLNRVLGILSVQSYTPNAYTEADLALLQALADHCGNAIARIQVEGLLQHTEELYRRAIGGVGAVPYAYDYRTRAYTFIGEGIEQLTGYKPNEICAKAWLEIVKESTMAGDAAGLEKEEASRQVVVGELRQWRCDMRIVSRDGKTRWLSDASVQNLDESGRVIGAMGILEDITERKRSELCALALSKLSQQLISAVSPSQVARLLTEVADGLFGWDACSFFLYTEGKAEGQPVLSVDVVNGQRTDVTPKKGLAPSAIEQRVMADGAELTVRAAAELSLNPEAVPFGDVSRPSACIMRVPLRLRTNKVSGVVAFHSYTAQVYTPKDLHTLQTMADCCGVAIERIWAESDSQRLHRQLMDMSREAGMAEVATSVLHNVGNVLNSVNISSSLVTSKIRASKVANLAKAVALLQEHANDLGTFVTQDPKGKQLPGYLASLAEHLATEQRDIIEEVKSLAQNVEHINEIVAMQQSYARVIGLLENLSIVELVEDALRLNAAALTRHQVQLVREYTDTPSMLVDKHKVLQILINLIRNAKYALDDGGKEDKRLTVRIAPTEQETVRISIRDNGVGIPVENLTRIFEHGFTTRKHGHGFGLHNGALAAKELGGSLSVHSEGRGCGATFTLELPLKPKQAAR